jgi:MraZ protein
VFVGTFEHSLDDKGRVVLPSMFRSHLAERGFVSQFDKLPRRLDRRRVRRRGQATDREDPRGPRSSGRHARFSANAAEVRPDSRVASCSRSACDFAGSSSDVVVIGAIDRIEIWDSTRWGAASARADESLIHAVTALGI